MRRDLTFAINSKLLAKGVSASDEEVAAAVAFAYHELKLVVEPGGAVGLAALLAGRFEAKGKNVVIVLCGGNVEAELFAKLVTKEKSRKRSGAEHRSSAPLSLTA